MRAVHSCVDRCLYVDVCVCLSRVLVYESA